MSPDPEMNAVGEQIQDLARFRRARDREQGPLLSQAQPDAQA